MGEFPVSAFVSAFISRNARRIALAAAASLAVAVVSVPTAAQACTPSASSCTARYAGLLLLTSGKVRGEIDYTNKSFPNNLNVKDFVSYHGDNQTIKAPLRDRNSGDGDKVYVRWDYYTNGSYCYTSGIGVSAGIDSAGVNISIGCTSGWHSFHSDVESSHTSSTSWIFMTRWEYIDAKANSMRATTRVCQDEAWVSDECSGSRLLGISY